MTQKTPISHLDPHQMAERGHCEGNCEQTHGGHAGPCRVVNVIAPNQTWGFFSYCDNAVAEDELRGFRVEQPTHELGVEGR